MDFASMFKEILSMSRSTSDLKEVDREEAARRKNKCGCGYDPHRKDCDEKDQCSVKLALRNHITFPSFYFITEYDEPSTIYYDLSDVGFFPARHWAILLEIKNNISLARPGLVGWNHFGELVQVHFYHSNDEKPKTFEWSDMKPGNTMAILYPERKTFLDLSEGIREESLDSCFIFKAPFEQVQNEAQLLLRNADLRHKLEQEECFGCGAKQAELKQCANCKLAKYCSKECQVKCWKEEGHKKLCAQSEVLLKLAALPRHKFNKYFMFDNLPEFVTEKAKKKKNHQKKKNYRTFYQ